MFGHLFGLLLLFLTLEASKENGPYSLSLPLGISLLICVGFYFLLLFFLYSCKKFPLKKIHNFIVHGTLLLFVFISLNVLGLERLFSFFPPGQKILTSFLFIFLYFIGLGIGIHTVALRFLLPFALPFLFYLIVLSSLRFLSLNTALVLFFGLFIITSLLFFPFLFRTLWNCQSLAPSPLRSSLEAFCKQVHFSVANFYLWQGMKGTATAALIGALPKLRYLLYTEDLLKICTAEEIKAVTAHEWGHHKKKHLLLYPLLLAGAYPLFHLFSKYTISFPPTQLFFLYILFLFLFVRYVFGFFSRQCEKEADLQALKVGINPGLLIEALEKVGRFHHMSLSKFHWHHGSMQGRINLIRKVAAEPNQGIFYERVCFFSRLAYFIFIGLISYLFW